MTTLVLISAAILVSAGFGSAAQALFKRLTGFRRNTLRAQQRAVEKTTIAEAQRGRVHVEGEARAVDQTTLVSPLTARECLAYSWVVESPWKIQDENNREAIQWNALRRETVGSRFELDDGTGTALVDGTKQLAFAGELTQQAFPAHKPPPELAERLDKERVPAEGREIRIEEQLIAGGAQCAVVGNYLTDEAGGDAGYRQAAMMPVITGDDEGLIVICDNAGKQSQGGLWALLAATILLGAAAAVLWYLTLTS